MRPRRKLAIFSTEETTLDQVSFVLGLAGFAVSTASTVLELHGILFYEQPQGLLVIDGPEPLAVDSILSDAKADNPELRTVVLVRKAQRRWQFDRADLVLCQPEIQMAELRESLKTMMARKRGPKGRRSYPSLAVSA